MQQFFSAFLEAKLKLGNDRKIAEQLKVMEDCCSGLQLAWLHPVKYMKCGVFPKEIRL